MDWKVDMELRMEPPIQVKNYLSGGPTTFSFAVGGVSMDIYFMILSGVPGNIVDPPLRITFE